MSISFRRGTFGRSLKKADEAFQWKGPLPDLSEAILCDRYNFIDETLGQLVDGAEKRPAWADAWEHSTRGRHIGDPLEAMATPEERLVVFKQVRDSGDLPYAAGFYLVADQMDFLTECSIAERFEQAEHHFCQGLGELGHLYEHCLWEEAFEFRDRHPAKWDQLYIGDLVRHGEQEIASIYRKDRRGFQRLMKDGAEYFSRR